MLHVLPPSETIPPPPGFYTQREILSQPQVWAQALERLKEHWRELRTYFGAGAYDSAIVTGCGSTYYLALSAAAQMQAFTGVPCRGLPASELWLNPDSSYPRRQRILLVAVSRSGLTSETLHACREFLKSDRGDLVTYSCVPGAPLAGMGKLNLVFDMAQEESVAQTRAFSTLYLACLAAVSAGAGDERMLQSLEKLPAAGKALHKQVKSLAATLGQSDQFERFYFLGSGARYGLACEISLKMKEMSLSHSEPFHFMEFRHGPKSMVNERTLVLGMLSTSNRIHEQAVLDDMRALGARVLGMGSGAAEIDFPAGLSEPAESVLHLLFGQLLAFEHALHKGLNPDRPHNLDAVVQL